MHEKLNLIIYLNIYNNGRDKTSDKCVFELKLALGSVLVLVLKALNKPYIMNIHV